MFNIDWKLIYQIFLGLFIFYEILVYLYFKSIAMWILSSTRTILVFCIISIFFILLYGKFGLDRIFGEYVYIIFVITTFLSIIYILIRIIKIFLYIYIELLTKLYFKYFRKK